MDTGHADDVARTDPDGPAGPPRGSPPAGHVRVFQDEGCLLTLGHYKARVNRHAATVYFALGDKPLELHAGGQVLHARMAAVAPFSDLGFDTSGEPFGFADLLPLHPLYRAFRHIGGAGVMPLPMAGHDALLTALRQFHRGVTTPADAHRLFGRLANVAASRLPEPGVADARVAEAVRRLYQKPDTPLADLAASLALSVDRLSRLFAAEMGFSIRRYLQAIKVMVAGRYYGSGRSLTQIALASGFSDLAHFSKVWRRCYGTPPAYYFLSGSLQAWPPDGIPNVLWVPPRRAARGPGEGA